MKLADPRILTINGGSSSIRFALFEAGDRLVFRVIRTDEERMIAEMACRILGPGGQKVNRA